MFLSKVTFRLRLAMLPKQSNPVAKAAVEALRAPWSPKLPHRCQMFARLVYERVFGKRFEFAHKPDAIAAGISFQGHGYSVDLKDGAQPGDLLYKLKGSGGDGHVGVLLAGNWVAENSSVHWDGTDARGLRKLIEFGHFDLIVRLH